MSGVAALLRIGGPPDRAMLARMTRAMDARGPEGRDEATFDHGALGLVIGAPGEPEAGIGRAGAWTVALDGELLNLRALLAELRAWDEAPDRESSADVAATLFAARGFEGGLERLDGDVAIVAWDAGARRLWAARDRAGARPLHWAEAPDGTVLVASEPRALLAHPAVDAREDVEALREALAFGAPLPPRTPWRAIRALAPGELVCVDASGARARRWWTERANPTGADGARYRWARSAHLAAELAVQRRVAVDAPIAVALSPGVYAEALLASAAARRREPLIALTIAADGAAHPRVVEAAARARARLTQVPIALGEVPELLAATVSDEPWLEPEALGFRALARAAWEHGAAVLLTGVGGAALFGGASFPVGERAASVPLLGALARATRRGRADWARRHLERARGVADPPEAALEALAAEASTADPVGAALWLERRLVAGAALGALDRAASAAGLRAQSPFADAALAAFVGEVPVGHLVQVRRPRGLFLEAFAERLGAQPPEHRPMELPLASWLGSGVADGVAETLDDVLPGDTIRAILASGAPRRRWALAALAAWRRGTARGAPARGGA